MKYLLVFLSLFISNSLFAQTDSVQRQLTELTGRVNLIQANTDKAGRNVVKSYKIYTAGLTMQGVGMAIATVGGVLQLTRTNDVKTSVKSDNSGYVMVGVGAGLSGLGFIVTLFAPKYIKRAGIALSNNGVSIPIGKKK